MLSRVMRFGLVERGGPGDIGDSGLVQHKMSGGLDNEMIVRLNSHPHCTQDLLLDRSRMMNK